MFWVGDETEAVSDGVSAAVWLWPDEETFPPQATITKSPKTANILIHIMPKINPYIASAITSCTSGTIRFNKPSIPALRVMVEDGHPLHEPFNSTTTVPSSNDL